MIERKSGDDWRWVRTPRILDRSEDVNRVYNRVFKAVRKQWNNFDA